MALAQAARSEPTGEPTGGIVKGITASAYGLAFSAPGLETGMIVPESEQWLSVSIEQDLQPLPLARDQLDSDRAELALADGTHWLRMDRADARAVFHGPRIPPDDLVHPYLWPVASIFSRWLGREALHAGAIVVGGGAWVLIGPKEAGKSTLLAAHALRGGGVLTDDLVVIDGRRAFSGPRYIDLRSPLPDRGAVALLPTRGGARLRMTLPSTAPAVPVRGWLFLRWGETTELVPVSAATCLSRLARWRAWGELASDEVHLLDLAGLPAYDLVRERSWSTIDATLELLAHAEMP